MERKAIIPVFLFLFLGQATAQRVSVESKMYNAESGFTPYANFVHKDSRGLFWIGTHFGLYRFDGNEFVLFNEDTGLPFNRVLEIFEDNEGWFWLYNSCHCVFECEKNLAFFHPLTKRILTFEQRFGGQTSIKANEIVSIAQDSATIYCTANGKLLIWSSGKGIREVTLKGITETPYLLNKVNKERIGLYHTEYEKGNPNIPDFINPNMHYSVIDLEGNLIHPPVPISIADFHPDILLKMRRDFSTLERVRVKNKELSFHQEGRLVITTLPYELPKGEVNIPHFHFDENLWVNDIGEIYYGNLGLFSQIEVKNDTVKYFGHLIVPKLIQLAWIKKKGRAAFHQSFVGRALRHNFFDDATGSAWSAGPAGLRISHFSSNPFYQPTNTLRKNGLAYACISLNDKLAYLRTEPEILLYSVRDRSTVSMPRSYIDTESFRNKAFCHEKEDAHFWSTTATHLLRINKDDLSMVKYPFPSAFEAGNAAIKMNGFIWMGAFKEGIWKYDIQLDSFLEFTGFNDYESLRSSKVHFFLKEDNDQFWIATNSGIYLCSTKNGVLNHFGMLETAKNILPNDNIIHLSKAKTGGYWLATSIGLYRWYPNEKSTTKAGQSHFIKKDIPINEIIAAYEDDYGFVWMPTPRGLIQYQISTDLFKLHFYESGGGTAAFQKYAHDRGEDGTLFLGTYDGYKIFHPKDFKDVDLNPQVPLIITDFEQHVDETDKIEDRLEQFKHDREIVLRPGDKFFSLRVALADYRNADKHRFAYRIEGYQKDWQEDKSNLIRISGLPYGNFTLQIKGRLPDGQFASPVLSIPIRVLRPFYLQTWFFIVSFLALLLSIISFYRWRTQRLVKQKKELEEEVEKATQTISQQNKELKNLDIVKSRFFANVSHELRTPITLIYGPLTSMLKSGTLNERNATFAELGRKNAQNLLNLVNEILDLTKMESGKIELQEETVLFHDFLQRLAGAFSGAAQQKSINYQFVYLADRDLKLQVDVKKTEKLLNNLLSNAFKFTPAGGQITLRCEDKGQYLNISVKDSGRGIHPDDLPYVFDRYYQSSQPDVPKEGGTGIGLSLSQEFAKLMNGKLRAESTLGKGSTIYFEFPKKTVSSQVGGSTSPIKTNENIPPASDHLDAETEKIVPLVLEKSYSLLLVEDNESLRDYIHLIIDGRHQLKALENGKLAWEYLTAGNHPLPDLIISDIMMPEMDGYQLLSKLKGDDRFRAIPVIMLTALAELKDKLQALRIGVDDYMTKPFEEEELLARVDNLLRHSEWRRQYLQETMEPTQGHEQEPNDASAHPSPAMSEEDSTWLEELENIVKEKLGNFDFSLEQLAHEMASNRWTLYRRIKQLTGLTATQYLKEIRLNHARHLLEQKQYNTVKALSLDVGMKDIKYFSREFKKRFGKLPSEYL